MVGAKNQRTVEQAARWRHDRRPGLLQLLGNTLRLRLSCLAADGNCSKQA